VTNDLTSSCEADGFRAAYPDRFFALGMAEQNLIGVAAGMAREGWEVVYPTFGVFATRRPYEQIAMAIAYPALPVRLFGFLPGITTPGGPTHQAIDDLGLMTLLPNMTVIELADATDVETVWPTFDRVRGPIYCRMLRGEVPRLFEAPFELGRMRRLRDGDDVLVISSGVTVEAAAEATERLAATGIGAGHVHVSTLKPFDDEALVDAIAHAGAGVVTVENHLVNGGLGTAVATMIAERGMGARLTRLGLQDTYAHGGSRPYLTAYYGFAAGDVVAAAEQLVGRHSGRRLETIVTGPSLSRAVAEGL
jgi:transketolase